MITITEDPATHRLQGSATYKMGYYESMMLRNELAGGQEQKDYFNKKTGLYPLDITINDNRLDSLTNPDEPVTATFHFTGSTGDAAMLYINPMMEHALKENPLTALQRTYPVELPYRMDELYVLDLQVPAGYKVEELPGPQTITLNDRDGLFEFINDVGANGHIRLKSRVVLNKTRFTAAEYPVLRQFFGSIVKKHAAQIVLKKQG